MADKIHRGRIKRGKFSPNEPSAFRLQIAKMEGKQIEVIVRLPKKIRSDPQRKYYFGVVVPILSEYTGFTKEEMHLELKRLFLSEEVKGKKVTLLKTRSTTELTTVEFMGYIAEIQQWASESFDLYIPDPDEVEL